MIICRLHEGSMSYNLPCWCVLCCAMPFCTTPPGSSACCASQILAAQRRAALKLEALQNSLPDSQSSLRNQLQALGTFSAAQDLMSEANAQERLLEVCLT